MSVWRMNRPGMSVACCALQGNCQCLGKSPDYVMGMREYEISVFCSVLLVHMHYHYYHSWGFIFSFFCH